MSLSRHFTMRLLLIGVILVSSLKGTHSLQFNVLNSGNVYQFSEDENEGGNGEVLGTVVCTEAGGDVLPEPVQYEILEPDSVPFQLDIDSGELTLKTGETLDFETAEQYEFNISCNYTTMPGNATAMIRFTVGPVNEFEPDISDTSLTVTISELTPVGTVLVSTDSSGLKQVMVTDRDNGPDGVLTFSTSNNAPDLTLNENTGSLTLTQTIDLDSGGSGLLSFVYTIVVCDGDRPIVECFSIDVRIIVRADNDNPPMFEQDEYTLRLSETTPVGTNLTTVVCTDADRHGAGEFSGITLEPDDAPVYIPDPTNGTVVLRESVDFEITQSLTLSLVCSDTGDLQDTATLQITITPENDQAPQFNLTLYEFSVDRITVMGQEIGQVIAVDPDQDPIMYTLSGPGSENFQLRPDGTLVLNEFVLVIEGSFFELMVTASDGTFNDTATVHITVDGLLSIPEVIIVSVCALIFLVLLIIFVCIFFCCCIGCYRCLPEKKKQIDGEEMMMPPMDHMDFYPHPAMLPPPSMYDHGGPVYQMAQDPRHMDDGWRSSQDLLDTEEGEDEPDIALSSDLSSSRMYNPNTLKEVVDIFHEGDKVLGGKKKKKDKKQDK